MDFEVLAPAGSWDALVAGVRCGADAVYFGTKSLNARQNAGNFNLEEFERAIFYCLAHNVKPYITLNILCKDNEFEEAYKIVRNSLSCGAKSFIVQDLGIAQMIKDSFPDAVLHASTQMSVTSAAGAHAIEKLGFSRIVLARELDKKQILQIRKSTNLSLEVFVHGALCMSVSGQCYLSSMIGGRSGNRGLCAQPCRLPFSICKRNYCGLSLKDLSLVGRLQELYDCGVESLKIEGRMKRPEYVAAAVTTIKNAISGRQNNEDTKLLSDVFNRGGFTTAYFDGTLKDMFGVRENENINEAISAEKELSNLYKNEKQTIPLNIQCIIKTGEKLQLNVTSPFKEVSVEGDVVEIAKKKPLSKDTVISQLSKLGGTQFYLHSADVLIEDNTMVSLSQLNALRRKAVDELNTFVKTPVNVVKATTLHNDYEERKEHGRYLTARFTSPSQIPEDHPFKRIFLPLESKIDDFKRYSAGVELPRLIFDNEKNIKDKLDVLKNNGVQNALCCSIESYALASSMGFNVFGDFGLNVMNSTSCRMVRHPILSFELSLEEINKIRGQDVGVIVYGFLPLMLTKNCPIKNEIGCKKCKNEYNQNAFLQDRTKRQFHVKCSPYGYSELFNCVPLYMGDKLDKIDTSFLHFYFTDESKESIKKLIQMYANNQAADFEFTRGHFYKKVL